MHVKVDIMRPGLEEVLHQLTIIFTLLAKSELSCLALKVWGKIQAMESHSLELIFVHV